MMGGDVELESSVGTGSTFTLWLPAEVQEQAAIDVKDNTAPTGD